MVEDQALVERILAGETGLFRTLIDQYRRLVIHVVYRLIPNETDREDICQEVFCKVYQNLKTFRHDSKLSTWIARVAYNTCLNFLDKKKLPLYDDLISEEDDMETTIPDNSNRPDMLFESGRTADIVRQAIESLPVKYKAIVTLYHLDQMGYNEIAKTLNLPEGTVKSYLFRARKLLKDRLMASYRPEEI
jgi:RNA polymerase sigma factor (sigma-70 family)